MAKGGGVKVDQNRGIKRRRVRPIGQSSDSSDEDYVVSEEEENEVSDEDFMEDCDLLDGDEDVLEETVGRGVDLDEDEYEEDEVQKVIRSKVKKGSKKKTVTKKKNNRQGRSCRKKRVSRVSDDEDDDDEDYYEEDDAEFDAGDDEDDGDEDFSLDEDASLDEEDEFVVKKKRKIANGRSRLTKGSGRDPKTRKKSRISKKPLQRTGRKHTVRNRERYDDDDDDDEEEPKPILRKRTRTNLGCRTRGHVISDSDFEAPGSESNYEYTISEEEREQVREAERLCKRLSADMRSSSTAKSTEDGKLARQKKPSVKKGKEKIEEVIKEVVKQVCGICLSEEDKRRVRGTLDCCNHYFCFTCIMEWSKVESRCPLCKQRFKTISKPAKSTAGIGLRSVVVEVAERDQVYQPSEEELRGYMDPYENVICTECHLGGDDSLMLLCDLCDSPAHTYCVGLGHEVPEGNWYCDGCRPVALGSSAAQVQQTPPDQRLRGNSFLSGPSPREALDLNSFPSSNETSFQGLGNMYSPRYPGGDARAASPAPGSAAPTLSRRRWIHNHIQNLLSSHRMDFLAGRAEANTSASSTRDLFAPQEFLGRGTSFQHAETSSMGTLNNFSQENVLNNPSMLLPNQEAFPLRLGGMRTLPVQDQSSLNVDRSIRGTVWDDLRGISTSGFDQQFQGSSISGMGSDGSVSPHIIREGSHFYEAKERLQLIVKDHLKILSKDINLGHNTFKDVARSSTHTILAACGLEHRRNEVYPMPPPPACPHVENLVIGQTSLMKGYCSSCFDSFVRNVVKTILNSRLPSWLVGSRG